MSRASFMGRGQAALLALFLLATALMASLYASPLRDYHVFPEGAAIVLGTALAASFRRVYGILLPLSAALTLAALKIYGADGMYPTNIAYIYLVASIAVSLPVGLLVKPRGAGG